MNTRRLSGVLALAALGGLLAGCPGLSPEEFITGVGGASARLGTTALVDVVSPTTNVSLTGGTPLEVNWRVTATTNFSTVDIIFDEDRDPDNGNEFSAATGLTIDETTALLDTSDLAAGTYSIGVLLNERNELAAFDYAPGNIIVNQRPQLFFTSPRDNFRFDRSNRISARFDVAWQVFDPDSTVSVRVFLDDPGSGQGILLRESSNQTGDSFTFDLPTANFEPGTYRILAVVSDGVGEFEFFAPGSIQIRARIAGYQDLRDHGTPAAVLSGAVFEGFNPRDNLGSFVTSIRDIDGDGFSDFVMLAQFAKPEYSVDFQRVGVGEAYLIYGRQDHFTGRINVNSTGRLFRGDVFTGPHEVVQPIRPTRGITSFTALSDWDQDGVLELAFGMPFTDSRGVDGPESFQVLAPLDCQGYFRTGSVVIASGSVLRPDFGFPGGNVIELDRIGTETHEAPTPGFPEGFFGPKACPPPGGGEFTQFHRHLNNIPAPFVAAHMGCRISSNDFADQFGTTVASYAFEGIIISAPNRDPFKATRTANLLNLSAPGAGTVSVHFNPTFDPRYPWSSVNTPPANGTFGYVGLQDNIDLGPGEGLLQHGGPYQFIMDEFSSPGGDLRANAPGYLVDPDHDGPLGPGFAFSAPHIDTTTRFWSQLTGGALGEPRRGGDFNNDGLEDILIGHPLANGGDGACYIVLGRLQNLVKGAELMIDELGLPMNAQGFDQARVFDGIRLLGAANERLGSAQDAAGDFNGDGIEDVVIGSSLLNNRRGGAAVFFGSRDVINLTQEEIRFNDLPTRGLGVIFVGEGEGDLAGARIRGVGDVDGDGLSDILIAAPNKSVQLDLDLDGTIEADRQNCGVVYLVYGSSELRGTISLADIGTEALPGAMFIGRNSGDQLGAGVGEQGDRSFGVDTAGDVNGDGRRDLLMGSVTASPRDRVAAGEVYLIYGVVDGQ